MGKFRFITAAFRMGHSMVLQQLRQYNVSNAYYGQQSNFMFGSIVFQSDYAYSSTYNGLNSIFVGLLNMNSWLFGTFGNQLQNNLVINLFFHFRVSFSVYFKFSFK